MKFVYLTLICLLFTASSFVSAQEKAPKIIHGGVLNGKAISLPRPEYPDVAKAAGVEGAVSVEVTIDESGNIESAKAVKQESEDSELSAGVADSRAALRDAAERAALQARFSPTLLSGMPVKVSGVIVYNFKLGNDNEMTPTIDGAGSLNGKAIELPLPVYPDAAKAVRASGVVKVEVTIDENGNVIAAKAISGHPLLQSSAVAAARKARFTPVSTPDGPAKVIGILSYNFEGPPKKQ
jgi:TonB family protein